MLVLIFDTFGGLCNQFYDIINGINFCLKHNIFFTFRNCSFRNNDLISWTDQPFEKLFDLNFLNKYKLYINYYDIKLDINNENCFNLNGEKRAILTFGKNNILEQLISLNKKYVVLKQFWSIYNSQPLIDRNVQLNILPSKNIMDKYIEIKNTFTNELYNFIHYRYEIDFTQHFKINIESLDRVIENIKFKNNDLNVYIATSNINKILDMNNCKYKNLIYKNDDILIELNFEQKAFIDFMIGINSVEGCGNQKSSFSQMIKNIKGPDKFSFYM